MTTTTQQTSKIWKGVQGIGCLTSLGALAMIMIGFSFMDGANRSHEAKATATAVLWLFGGLAVYTFGRVGAWWSHG